MVVNILVNSWIKTCSTQNCLVPAGGGVEVVGSGLVSSSIVGAVRCCSVVVIVVVATVVTSAEFSVKVVNDGTSSLKSVLGTSPPFRGPAEWAKEVASSGGYLS